MSDFLDDFYLYGVRDAVADDFELYAFNCIFEQPVPILYGHVLDYDGID